MRLAREPPRWQAAAEASHHDEVSGVRCKSVTTLSCRSPTQARPRRQKSQTCIPEDVVSCKANEHSAWSWGTYLVGSMHPVRWSKQLDLFRGDAKTRCNAIDFHFIIMSSISDRAVVHRCFLLQAPHALLELLDFVDILGWQWRHRSIGGRTDSMRRLCWMMGILRSLSGRLRSHCVLGKVPIGAHEVWNARTLTRPARRSQIAPHFPATTGLAGFGLALPLSHWLQIGLGRHAFWFNCCCAQNNLVGWHLDVRQMLSSRVRPRHKQVRPTGLVGRVPPHSIKRHACIGEIDLSLYVRNMGC